MTAPHCQLRAGYFGKLPSRSDFVKATDNHVLAELLDQWLAEAMNRLTANPRWKQHYDSLQPMHFAFVGTRSHHAIAGHIAASCDLAGRRYPFLTMSAVAVAEPQTFLVRSPMVFHPFWHDLAERTDEVLTTSDPAHGLHALAAATFDINPGGLLHAQTLEYFLDTQTLASLDTMLALPRLDCSVRRLFLALGLLLLPLRDNGDGVLDRSLLLPLPRDPALRPLVASLWLELASRFLSRRDVELAVFMAEVAAQPMFVLGFCGASPTTLQGLIDPEFGAGQHVTFDDTDWVEDTMVGDGRLQKLSSCLEQEQLTLQSAVQLFQQTFA